MVPSRRRINLAGAAGLDAGRNGCRDMKTIVTWLVLILGPLAARADLIWSRQINLESHNSGTATAIRIWCDGRSQGYRLFDTLTFSPNDVGRTFTIASPDDDPDFPNAVKSLTDGVDDAITIFRGTSSPYGGVFAESALFSAVPREGPDLLGYRIDAFHLTIDELWIGRTDFSNPALPWTDTYGQATLRIEGVLIPEPGAGALVGMGLALGGTFSGRQFSRRCLIHRGREAR
ncbi:MAG: hypothetical protein BWX84_00783 [Verrucomicrobia bacterium ADurb.Bin118]|nr:MAG: hypothetical protein BWX84_00783 [Verrucomicrobia bacterium ADurb.Bin118]